MKSPSQVLGVRTYLLWGDNLTHNRVTCRVFLLAASEPHPWGRCGRPLGPACPHSLTSLDTLFGAGFALFCREKHKKPQSVIFNKRDFRQRICRRCSFSFIPHTQPALERDKGTLADPKESVHPRILKRRKQQYAPFPGLAVPQWDVLRGLHHQGQGLTPLSPFLSVLLPSL